MLVALQRWQRCQYYVAAAGNRISMIPFFGKPFIYNYTTLSMPIPPSDSNFIAINPTLNSFSIVVPAEYIRNVAIIAHVDHGKTTLVDCLLQQSGCLKDDGTESRVMDSNELERERGITILAKSTSIQRGLHRINLVDTPGHADFGGEVERVLSMVDGVALVVDATEGPMAQTKFVLSKALKLGLKPVVVLNKVDRVTSRPDEVDSLVLDLFAALDASDEQMSYPLLYASAKEGWAVAENPMSKLERRQLLLAGRTTLDGGSSAALGTMNPEAFNKTAESVELTAIQQYFLEKKMDDLFTAILTHVPGPRADRTKPFSLLINSIENNAYLGKCFMGKIETGIIRTGDRIRALASPTNQVLDDGRVNKIFVRRGLNQIVIEEAAAGDIVSIAGLNNASINSTLASPDVSTCLPATAIDPPTLSMVFAPNSSPSAGSEGRAVTTQQLGERLRKEAEINIALSVCPAEDGGPGYQVSGRGELQLGILLETLRREGIELVVSPPRVLLRPDPVKVGSWLEPLEEVTLDVDSIYVNVVIDKMTRRRGELQRLQEDVDGIGGKVRLIFHVPTRGLLGYPAEFKNDTHGAGVLTHALLSHVPYRGKLQIERRGALVSMADGIATAYALNDLESRGTLFISPGARIYQGMIVGESSRELDLDVNPTRTKVLTNMRSVFKEEAIRLAPPRYISLEESIAYIAEDEMLEVTPKMIRLRKAILDPALRSRKKPNTSSKF